MKNKFALVSFLYPAVVPYLEGLLKSVFNQTFTRFDCWVVNDGVTEKDLAVVRQFPVHILPAPQQGIPLIRSTAIKYFLDKGYEYIVFQDADDELTINRVEDAANNLEQYTIVAHDLRLVGDVRQESSESVWKKRLGMRCRIAQDFIADKNIFGFGNSSVRYDSLQVMPELKNDLIAPDWCFFYQLLTNANAVFSSNAAVLYRQHHDNTAGLGTLTRERIAKAISVKENHYRFMMDLFPDLQLQLQLLERFKRDIFDNEKKLNEYINNNQHDAHNLFWWEETNLRI